MNPIRKSRRAVVAAVAVTALVPSGVVASAQAFKASAAATKTVNLKNKRFSPATVTISKGSKVKWVWADPGHKVPHNIIASKFKGASLRKSGTYTVTFKKKGTFTYLCSIHPGMNGKVIVK